MPKIYTIRMAGSSTYINAWNYPPNHLGAQASKPRPNAPDTPNTPPYGGIASNVLPEGVSIRDLMTDGRA